MPPAHLCSRFMFLLLWQIFLLYYTLLHGASEALPKGRNTHLTKPQAKHKATLHSISDLSEPGFALLSLRAV